MLREPIKEEVELEGGVLMPSQEDAAMKDSLRRRLNQSFDLAAVVGSYRNEEGKSDSKSYVVKEVQVELNVE